MSNAPDDDDGVNPVATPGVELVVHWEPGQDQQLFVVRIQANGVFVVTDASVFHSNAIFSLPAPNAAGAYELRWDIAPAVDRIRKISLLVRRKGETRGNLVDQVDNPPIATAWLGNKTIDAP